MTVGKKLHKTLASLRSAKADMETYALETEDKQAQQLYNNGAEQLNQLVNNFANRVNYTEQEEPQYKVKKNNQQKNQ